MGAIPPAVAECHDEEQTEHHSESEKQTARDLRAGSRDGWECEAGPWEEGPDASAVFAEPLRERVWSRLLRHRHRVCLKNLQVLCVREEGRNIDNGPKSHAYHMMKTRTASCCGRR